MEVVKRDGSREPVDFNKVLRRISLMVSPTPTVKELQVEPVLVAQKVIQSIVDGITTEELDRLTCEVAQNMVTLDPDYGLLAGRIAMSNLHKSTTASFSYYVMQAFYHKTKDGKAAPLVSEAFYKYVQANAEYLDTVPVSYYDYEFDYFGFKTLEKSYLLRTSEGKIIERVGYMYLRVAIQLYGIAPRGNDLEKVAMTYNAMHGRLYTHATPTLFNAGTNLPQLASCFLLDLQEDSISGIYETLGRTAKISKLAGGIGLSISKVRAKNSYIKGTGGYSNGLVPMLKVFNETARYVDQGGGKRKGAFAIYIEPWHADIIDVLDIRKNHGKEELRARDLFPALWIPDLFMQRVEQDLPWSLFSPSDVPQLTETYGEEFTQVYEAAEAAGKAVRTIPARDLLKLITASQQETGTPYMLYKDTINARNNQCASGIIRSSNLCAEIVEVTGPEEIAVCNLASINLSMFTDVDTGSMDWDNLERIVRHAVRSLNQVIDCNLAPLPQQMWSNNTLRPVGLGVQGLADVFQELEMPYTSEAAKDLNRRIFEFIYYHAVDESADLVSRHGYTPFEGFAKSPMAAGKLQYHLAGKTNADIALQIPQEQWQALSEKVRSGVANSLLIALMPTASTSQIFGATESFEPVTSNLYVRRTLGGEYMVINKQLVAALKKRNLWSKEVAEALVASKGTIQAYYLPALRIIPDDIKEVYRTVWEIPMREYINMAADRQLFVCQSQSMNLYMQDVTSNKLISMHHHAWKSGLKTGMYYFRTQAAVAPIAFTVDVAAPKEPQACSLDNPDCEACSA